jgi:hypothetical protein
MTHPEQKYKIAPGGRKECGKGAVFWPACVMRQNDPA